MALRHKISKSQFDALSDDVKKEYMADGSDYVLDVVGLPEVEDVGPLKRANERLKEDLKKAKETATDLQAKIDAAPNVDAINAEHAKVTKKLTDFTEKTLKQSVAESIAAEISTAPKLLVKHLVERITVDLTGDEPKSVILGTDGKASALTPEQLGQEFVANKDFASIIKASKASGGGAPSTPTPKPLGGGAPAGDQQQPANLATMPGADLAARIKARIEGQANGGQQ